MVFIDWIQILIFVLIVILLSPLMGKYIALVFLNGQIPPLSLLKKLENLCYRFFRIDPEYEMNWKEYLSAILILNFWGLLTLFLMLVLQIHLPLNPQKMPSLSWDLAFNIAVSFITNTDWQAYSGETTLSYFTQMVGLTTQNFLSAATGLSVLLVFIRGFKNRLSNKLGNFWVDLTRAIVYIFLPLSFIFAILLVHQGVIQTLNPYLEAITIENEVQIIPQGPVASQVAIKQLGSSGGGFFGANSAHPYENPTPISNYMQHLAMVLIPFSLTFTFGYLVNDRAQGTMIFCVMMLFWIITIVISNFLSYEPNPALSLKENMEGIETRFSISNSYFWTISASDSSTGSTNGSISSYTPLASGLALFNIMLGELVIGGAGTGMCTILKYILLSVFIAGLMVGRTPEYLGKKIEKTEILWVMIAGMIPCFLILGGTAFSHLIPSIKTSITREGPQGYFEILYAFASTTQNNGSAMKGFIKNTPILNIVFSLVMIIGRLSLIIPSLAIAGSLSKKKYYPPSSGTLNTKSILFGLLLSSIIFIIGSLTYFPSLILGPVTEHFLMMRGLVF